MNNLKAGTPLYSIGAPQYDKSVLPANNHGVTINKKVFFIQGAKR